MSETEKEELTLRQIEGERLALDHQGEFGLHGTHSGPPMQHAVAAQFEHTTPSNQPLVHMVCWDEERACELNGRIVVAGDDKAPVHVRMAHDFTNEHHQHHRVEPVNHTLHVDSQLAKPIHHALQLRTPLQMRFCNPWHLVSDYVMEIRLGNNQLISMHLTGATVVTPQPCPDDEPCPTVITRT